MILVITSVFAHSYNDALLTIVIFSSQYGFGFVIS
jgi:hypothetical protein